MKKEDLIKSSRGRLVQHPNGYLAFVPHTLPRQVELSDDLVSLLTDAMWKIGLLEGLCRRLPNPHLISGAYAHIEAVRSSRIEGTQTSDSDLYLFEMETEREFPADVNEVRNYIAALDHGLKRRAELPLSLRLIREMHKILLSGVRGQHKAPGEFRQSQNWIGGPNPGMAKFVPPPPGELPGVLDEFEKFLHRENPSAIPPLIECALVHHQFETIHPFLDGNGRIGRLLITLLAIERGVLSYPVLYLSAYLEKNRDSYMDHLYALNCTGDWLPWLDFFLEGVAGQAEDATRRAERILDLQAKYMLQAQRANTRRLIELLMTNPFITVKAAAERLGLSYPGAKAAVTDLIPSVLQPYGQPRKRGQIYVAKELFEAMTGGL